MGHESLIEPWLAPDHRSACQFQNCLASLRICDGELPGEKFKIATRPQRTEEMERAFAKPPARLHGLEDKKNSSRREALSLDIPLYRTTQELSPRHRQDGVMSPDLM